MIDLAILGLLSDQELHGYELTKRLADLLGPGASVSFGSVYPALGRLERAGLVKAVEAAARLAAPIPMTGSLAGELAAARSQAEQPAVPKRARKVYGITPEGEARLLELLTEPAGVASASAFDVRLGLFRHLEPAQRLTVIEQRRAALIQRHDDVIRLGPGDRFLQARQARELALIEHDLAWLTDLAAAELTELNDLTQNPTAPPAPDHPGGNQS